MFSRFSGSYFWHTNDVSWLSSLAQVGSNLMDEVAAGLLMCLPVGDSRRRPLLEHRNCAGKRSCGTCSGGAAAAALAGPSSGSIICRRRAAQRLLDCRVPGWLAGCRPASSTFCHPSGKSYDSSMGSSSHSLSSLLSFSTWLRPSRVRPGRAGPSRAGCRTAGTGTTEQKEHADQRRSPKPRHKCSICDVPYGRCERPIGGRTHGGTDRPTKPSMNRSEAKPPSRIES